MGKKGDLSDFECGMFVGARRAGLSISKTFIIVALIICLFQEVHYVLIQ